MTREIQQDFEAVKSFISAYTLQPLLNDAEAMKKISSSHAKYYAVLTLFHELKHTPPKVPFQHKDDKTSDHLESMFWLYLEETISELGSTLFLISNGFYKAAGLVLRSSLENFFKLSASFHHAEIYTTKSTYEVIELAKKSKIFESTNGAKIFNSLHSSYVELCKAVHTATIEDMQTVSALGHFPHIDKVKLDKLSTHYTSITSKFTDSLCLLFKDTFHKIHFKNRDIIQAGLSKPTLRAIYTNV
ncbi:hypothetical protein PSCICO_44890 [Pseudomonas cichorii]|uniref:hypothetical protein n=1 Tax=Pseudomonas cichorii TaxID=36746 RepID=UPI001910F25F|nr:hypothetical protein [Pseudomonas cichorii]GFM89090.1 hypothetical protein PSCICO_44890 [Pseudomonas cichorii]